MKDKTPYKTTILAGLLGSLALSAAAQEIETPTLISTGEQKVIDKLGGDFADFAGDDATVLIEALRTGADLSYEVEKEVEVEVPALDDAGDPVIKLDDAGNPLLDASGDPIPETTIETQTTIETVVVENTAGPLGFGNTQRRVSPSVSRQRPIPACGRSKAMRYAPTPTSGRDRCRSPPSSWCS